MQEASVKQIIQSGFDTVAQGYDHPSLPFFPQTASRLVGHLQLKPEQTLLDVCTGTGVVALTAAQYLQDGFVTGIDLSEGMLEQARRKAHSNQLKNVEFKQMDLDALSFSAASFDVATSSFGLFFMEDMARALGNIAQTVKSGGKLAITTFTGEAFSPMADIFAKNYEVTGRQFPEISWKRLATPELISEQYNAVGIHEIEFHHEPLGYHMTSADMWWDVVWNAGWRSLLNMMTKSELEQFKSAHLAEISKLIGSKGVWFNTEVLIAIGTKPGAQAT